MKAKSWILHAGLPFEGDCDGVFLLALATLVPRLEPGEVVLPVLLLSDAFTELPKIQAMSQSQVCIQKYYLVKRIKDHLNICS